MPATLLQNQTILGTSPQSVFTVPTGIPASGYTLKMQVNGVVVPYSWTGATQVTLKTAAPARAIVNFLEEADPNKGCATAEAAIDFPAIAAQGSNEVTISNLKGALPGDIVTLGLPSSIPMGLIYTAYVSAAETVKVRASNITAAAIDAVSGTFRVAVNKA